MLAKCFFVLENLAPNKTQLRHLFGTSFADTCTLTHICAHSPTCKHTQHEVLPQLNAECSLSPRSAALTELSPFLISNPLSAWQRRLFYSWSIFSKPATQSQQNCSPQWGGQAGGALSFFPAHANGGKAEGLKWLRTGSGNRIHSLSPITHMWPFTEGIAAVCTTISS